VAKFFKISPSAVILGTAIFSVVVTHLTSIPHTIYDDLDLFLKTSILSWLENSGRPKFLSLAEVSYSKCLP